MVNNLPANAEDAALIPGSEDPLDEEMTVLSNILAWRIPWTEETDGLQSIGLQRVGHDEWASEFFNLPWKSRSRIFQITYTCLLELFLCHPTSSLRTIYSCDFVLFFFFCFKFNKLGSVLGTSPALFVKCSFTLPVNYAISTTHQHSTCARVH